MKKIIYPVLILILFLVLSGCKIYDMYRALTLDSAGLVPQLEGSVRLKESVDTVFSHNDFLYAFKNQAIPDVIYKIKEETFEVVKTYQTIASSETQPVFFDQIYESGGQIYLMSREGKKLWLNDGDDTAMYFAEVGGRGDLSYYFFADATNYIFIDDPVTDPATYEIYAVTDMVNSITNLVRPTGLALRHVSFCEATNQLKLFFISGNDGDSIYNLLNVEVITLDATAVGIWPTGYPYMPQTFLFLDVDPFNLRDPRLQYLAGESHATILQVENLFFIYNPDGSFRTMMTLDVRWDEGIPVALSGTLPFFYQVNDRRVLKYRID